MKRKILAVAVMFTMFGYVISSKVNSVKADDNSFYNSETSSKNNDDTNINFISSLFSFIIVGGSMFVIAKHLESQQGSKLALTDIAFQAKNLALGEPDPEYEKKGLKFEYIENESREEVNIYLKSQNVYKAFIISNASSANWEGIPVEKTVSRVKVEHIESVQEWLPILIKEESK